MFKKDPTAFRLRFNEYKNGKMPYKNGLPAYSDGNAPLLINRKSNADPNVVPFDETRRIKLTNAGLATGAVLSESLLDAIADAAYRQGLPIRTAIGLATKESTLGNPTDDTSIYKILSPEKAEWFKQLGTGTHINEGGDMLYMKDVVNYHRPDNYPVDWNTFDRAFRFYADSPSKYNPGQKNHPKLVDKRGDEVMKSPEVLKWYKEWEDKQIQVKRPEPYKIETNIQNTAAPKFGKYANGKLPLFKDGDIPYITSDGVLYNINPNVVGAEQLNVGVPEVVVTGTDKRPMYQRYDAKHSVYDPEAIRNLTDWAPIVGDIGQGLDAYNAFKNQNYLLAGVLGGMLLLPNMIKKPTRYVLKPLRRFVNRFTEHGDDAVDASISVLGGAGGFGIGYASGDTKDEKASYAAIGSMLGAIPGGSRMMLRDLLHGNKYIPYSLRKIIDPIVDPIEYTKARIGGYYGKLPTQEELKNEILRLYKLWNVDEFFNNPDDLLKKTNILAEPEYVLKHGYDSSGIQLRGSTGGIDLLMNKRNSLLPPKNTMLGISVKNPLLGTYAHEINHYIHDLIVPEYYNLSERGLFVDYLTHEKSNPYYIPNESYILPDVTTDFKQIIGENWKKHEWFGSPEEFESEFQNYLSMHNIDYSQITKDQKNDLLRKISKKFNINDKIILSDLLDYLGNDFDGYTNSRRIYAYKDGKSPIRINPANRGKFNATKKRTGKTTEELAHSKNPLTRKRAIFALNARKWKH